MKPFFPLTSTFFGLTSDYKIPLLEEIWICTQLIKNFSYSDVLKMPTYERRFFIGQLNRDKIKQEEEIEKAKEMQENKKNNGKRTTKISGNTLKTKLRNGEIPLN